jgi:hypothetical protein
MIYYNKKLSLDLCREYMMQIETIINLINEFSRRIKLA